MRLGRAVFLAGLAGAILVVAFSGPAAAGAPTQLGPEQIRNYDVDVRIESTGVVRVHEVIDYDFGVIPKHGIFRDVPVRFDYEPKANHDRVYPIEVESVRASEGTPGQYTLESGDVDGIGLKRIKIGDPDRTITGPHTYEITYTLRGVLNGFEDHDELFLNAIGPGWPVTVRRATVNVEAPADISRVGCFSGPVRSRLPCASANSTGTTATFTPERHAAQRGVHDRRRHPQGRGPAAEADPRGALQPRDRVLDHASHRRRRRRAARPRARRVPLPSVPVRK